MPYNAEISRTNPSCFVFLVDQSHSMNDPWGAEEGSKKSQGVSDAINKLLQNLVIRCSKEEGIRDYYYVSVIGYGKDVGPALGVSARQAEPPPEPAEDEDASPEEGLEAPAGDSVLKGRDLVPISEIGDNPTRLETRTQKDSDGAGGIVEREVRFPVWFDPQAANGTPMCRALTMAQGIVHKFITDHPSCFPPIVINITDGESTDGDPKQIALMLRHMKVDDGRVLVFNLHLSSQASKAVVFPDNLDSLPDDYAKLLFEMSSVLPDYMRSFALQEGYAVNPGSRGFVFNGDIVSLIGFLDMGTRPGNLR
ncbi:MAG: vWA domain-containing protein [Planctomycetota bacterium]|jgi:hypothetical protein